MGAKVHLPGGRKGERQLKRLLKPVEDRKIESELGVPADLLRSMERRLKKLENADKGRDARLDKLWKWMQEIQRKEGYDNASKDNH